MAITNPDQPTEIKLIFFDLTVVSVLPLGLVC